MERQDSAPGKANTKAPLVLLSFPSADMIQTQAGLRYLTEHKFQVGVSHQPPVFRYRGSNYRQFGLIIKQVKTVGWCELQQRPEFPESLKSLVSLADKSIRRHYPECIF